MTQAKQYLSGCKKLSFIPKPRNDEDYGWSFSAGDGIIVCVEIIPYAYIQGEARVLVSEDGGKSWDVSGFGRYRPATPAQHCGGFFYIARANDLQGGYAQYSLWSTDGKTWEARPWEIVSGRAFPPGLGSLAQQFSWELSGQPTEGNGNYPLGGPGGLKVIMRNKATGRNALVVSSDGQLWSVSGYIGPPGATVRLDDASNISTACDGRNEVTGINCHHESIGFGFSFAVTDIYSRSTVLSDVIPAPDTYSVPVIAYEGKNNKFVALFISGQSVSLDIYALSSSIIDIETSAFPNGNFVISKNAYSGSKGYFHSSDGNIAVSNTEGTFGVNGCIYVYDIDELISRNETPRHGEYIGSPTNFIHANDEICFIQDNEGVIAIVQGINSQQQNGAHVFRINILSADAFWTNKVGTRET